MTNVITWKEIPGILGFAASTDGRVMNVDTNKVLVPRSDHNGYDRVNIWHNGKHTTFHVHRLVAMAHIDNPETKPFINHIDGVKKNNNVDNLEWVTPKENAQHAAKLGLLNYSGRFKAAEAAKKAIILIANGVYRRFASIKEAAEYIGVAACTLSRYIRTGRICRGYALAVL